MGLELWINSIPKWFTEINKISDIEISTKLRVFSAINNQIDRFKYNLEAFKKIIDKVIENNGKFIWYEDNWLYMLLDNYLKNWDIYDLAEYIEYKFYAIDKVKEKLKKELNNIPLLWWEVKSQLETNFINNFYKNKDFYLKIIIIKWENVKMFKYKFLWEDNLLNNYFLLDDFFKNLQHIIYSLNLIDFKWKLRFEFLEILEKD